MPAAAELPDCWHCKRRLRELPSWTRGAAIRVPGDIEAVADALQFGPSWIICTDCRSANPTVMPQRFRAAGGAVIEAVPDDAAGPGGVAVRGAKATRNALLQALLPAIRRYATELARQSGKLPRAARPGREVFCIIMLCALGVLEITSEGGAFSIRSRAPAEDPNERRRMRDLAVAQGAAALAEAIRRDAAPARIRRILPRLEARYRPLQAIFSHILAGAAEALGEAPGFAALAALAELADATVLNTPRRDEWSRALFLAEAGRAEDAVGLLVDPGLARRTIDAGTVLQAARELARDAEGGGYFPATEPGRRSRAALTRLLGEAVAGRSEAPLLDLGETIDQSVVTAAWPRVLSALPEAAPMRALIRTARAAALDIPALIRGGAEVVAAAAPERRAAFAIEAARALYFAPAAVLAVQERLGFAEGAADAALPGEMAWSLRSQTAEARRELGEITASLAIWQSLVETAPAKAHRHQAQQGVGSCLRQLGRFKEALGILSQVIAEGDPDRRIMATNALATTLFAAGRGEEARAAFEAELDTLRAQPFDWVPVSQFLSMYAQLLWHAEDPEARRWVTEARRSAIASGAPDIVATMDRLLGQETPAFAAAFAAATAPEAIAALALNEAARRMAAKDRDGAECLLAEGCRRIAPHEPPELWMMLIWRATLVWDPDDPGPLDALLGDAIGVLERLLARVAASDPEALLAPTGDSRQRLVACAMAAHSAGLRDAAFVRHAADLVMAPVLTARLRHAIPGAGPLTAEALATLWRETPCILVQVVTDAGRLTLILSQPAGDGRDDVRLVDLDIEPGAARRTARALAAHVKYRLGDGRQLGLDRIAGWEALAGAIRDALGAHAGWSRLAICPGELGSLVFSLALDPPWTICFVPSLTALLALRARRRALPEGLGFMPGRMADFAVWQEGDPPAVVAALQGTEADGRGVAAKHRLGYAIRAGRKATAPALLRLLAWSDLVRIACHGRIDAASESFELLVAADGELPPKSLIEEQREAARPHRLEQRSLRAARDVAPYVLSSACCSGAVTLSRSGERIGLERALFVGGTIAFCAPQWDVDAAEMRDQLAMVLDTWFNNDAAGLDAVTSQIAWIGGQQGVRPAITRALAVFGDGLGRATEMMMTMVIAQEEGRLMAPGPARVLRLKEGSE